MSLSGIWYHGSSLKFISMRLPKKYSPTEQLGFGIHFAKNKGFAERYGDVIYTCKLHPDQVLDVSEGMLIAPGDPMDKFAKEFFPRGYHPYFIDKEHYVFGQGQIDVRKPKDAEAILKKYGYDAVIYHAKYGTRSAYLGQGMHVQDETLAVTVLDPTKIEITDCEVTY